MSHTARGQTWAVRMPGTDQRAAGRLRCVPGVEACLIGEDLWLRGSAQGDALEKTLRMIPGAERFQVAADGQLRRAGGRVPGGRLPAGPWVALTGWLRVELPVARLAARIDQRVPLILVRSAEPEEANLLITGLDAWADYAVTAPQVRLQRWLFAAAGDGRVLVRGQPLPPLAGRRWVEREGITVPAGWTWSPPVEAAALRNLFRLEEDALILLHPDGTWEKVPGAELQRVCRSAVRATVEGLPHA